MSFSPPSKHICHYECKNKDLLLKLSIHCSNSVYVAGVYNYAILTFEIHGFVCYNIQTAYFFTLKTIDHLDLPRPTPSCCNLRKQEHL